MRAGKGIKVKVSALFHRLCINKNIRFQTHILWKRRTFDLRQTKTKLKRGRSTMSMAIPFSTKI